MAEIEADFLDRPLKDRSSFRAPPFIPRRKLKDLGTTTLSGERYFSSEFMKKEWEQVWTKTWHFVMQAAELARTLLEQAASDAAGVSSTTGAIGASQATNIFLLYPLIGPTHPSHLAALCFQPIDIIAFALAIVIDWLMLRCLGSMWRLRIDSDCCCHRSARHACSPCTCA